MPRSPFAPPKAPSKVSTKPPAPGAGQGLPAARAAKGNRAPRLRKETVRGTGPRIYHLNTEAEHVDGPGQPPAGFVRATTSASEWYAYYWIWWHLQCQGNVRAAPYVGSPDGRFVYQKMFEGGRSRAGGSVPDFVCMGLFGNPWVAIRLQTEQYHIYADNRQIVHDLMQLAELGKQFLVVDVYEQYLLRDPYRVQGTASQVIADAVQGIGWVGPIAGNTAYRVRL